MGEGGLLEGKSVLITLHEADMDRCYFFPSPGHLSSCPKPSDAFGLYSWTSQSNARGGDVGAEEPLGLHRRGAM